MRRPCSSFVISLLSLLLLLAGCKELTYTATITIGEGEVLAGVAQGYDLEVVDSDGLPRSSMAEVTRFEIYPTEGFSQGPGTLTFTSARLYSVKAFIAIDGQEVVATTTVDVSPGEPALVRLSVDADEYLAGETVPLEPVLTDAWDNPVSPPGKFALSADPSEGVSTAADGLTFIRAGKFTVTATEIKLGLSGTAEVKIVPSTPASARLTLSEARIRPGETILATLVGIDPYGNEAAIPAVYSTDPANGVSVKEDSLRFNEEGVFTVTGVGTSSTLSADALITVDGTPPKLTLDSPARAAFVSESPLHLQGTLLEPLAGIDTFTVNGETITVLGGTFDHAFVPTPGTNILKFEAKDLNGNSSSLVLSVLYAPAWAPLNTPLSGGMLARLNQSTLDVLSDYLMTLMVAEDLEADLMAENPIYTYSQEAPILTANVNVLSFGFGKTTGLMTPHADGGSGYLTIAMDIEDLYMELEAYGQYLQESYAYTGIVTADEGHAAGNARVTIQNGVADVTLTEVTVSLDGFDLWLSGSFLNALAGAISKTIEAELEAALADMIISEVPPLLVDTLNYLNYSTPLEVPVGDLTGVMYVTTTLEKILFDDAGGTIFETTQLNADSGGVQANPGSPLVGAGAPAFEPVPGYLLCASYDALNTVLHALWTTNVLAYSYSIEAEGGVEITASVSLPLPPVAQPSRDPAYVLEATAGDVALTLDSSAFSEPYLLAVSLVVPATVVSDEAGLTVSAVFGEPTVVYEVLAAPSRGLSADTLGTVVEELVVQLLDEAEGMATNIVIPEFEGYQLTVDKVQNLGSGWGYLTVGGELYD